MFPTMKTTLGPAGVVLIGLLGATPATASSPDAWEGFAVQVAAACQALAVERLEAPAVVVDPFGSENYGLALVHGKPKGGDGRVTYICVFDKKTRIVELGSELTDAILAGKP